MTDNLMFRRAAVKIQQGKRVLFLTFFTVDELVRDKFYRVDKLDISAEKGFQRVLDMARAKGLARDLLEADQKDECFLPTSVFLATAGKIAYDETKREISFSTASEAGVCPFSVVDGQHRIEGAKVAAEDNLRIREFPIAVTIAPELSDPEQMLQFLIVNTKQKVVNKGVEQFINKRLIEMKGFQQLPYIPKWVSRTIEKGSDRDALNIASFLNEEEDSPWQGKIQMADDTEKARGRIKQHSFVGSIKQYVLSANNPLARMDNEMRRKILKNYWHAVVGIFCSDDVPDSIVFKFNGAVFFHILSAEVIGRCRDERNYEVSTIKKYFESAREFLTENGQEAMTPEWWQSGAGASGLNRGAIQKIAAEFSEAIREAAALEVESEDYRI